MWPKALRMPSMVRSLDQLDQWSVSNMLFISC
jgi:hypothetical protein